MYNGGVGCVNRRILASRSRKGQAFSELVICIVIILTLILGITTFANLSLTQLSLKRDARAEVGVEALSRRTDGWVENAPNEESRSHPMHQINAYTRLHAFEPVLYSKLPTSNYTLAARDIPSADLGLHTRTFSERVPLDSFLIELFYYKPDVLLSERVTFPATRGLWR